jgi:predicted DNA repair protein MutK
MSIGLIALLDDVATLAKAAAASLDDIAGQAAKAGTKAAGVVIDDTAVTPRYLTEFSAARELPVVGKIALGSLKNKLLFLLPAALALSLLVPHAIMPLLMLGALYLCYEGAEKVYESLFPHAAHAHEAALEPIAPDAQSFEDQKVASAIKTDFILSAEIMTITLGAVPDAGFWTQAAVLAVVGIMITFGVYGVVAIIVKADDMGVAMARVEGPLGAPVRLFGRALVRFMPYFLRLLGTVGTAAMIWVGGGILLHGIENYGWSWPSHLLHDAGAAAEQAVPAIGPVLSWLIQAAGAGVVGLAIGLVAIPIMSRFLSPLWRSLKGRFRRLRRRRNPEP